MGLKLKTPEEWMKEYHPDKSISFELMQEYSDYYHFKKKNINVLPKSIITREELNKKYKDAYCLTVGRLKKTLEESDLPDSGLIMIQRIEDKYYDGIDLSGMNGSGCKPGEKYPEGYQGSGWDIFLKKGEQYYNTISFNKEMRDEIARRERGEEPEYEKIENPQDYIIEDEETLNLMSDQYHPAWCVVGYKDEEHLFIDLHY